MYRHAFVIGKCLPPHLGHLLLAQMSSNLAEHVTFALEEQVNEDIPLCVRVRWLQDAVPSNVTVVPLRGHHPQDPSLVSDQEAFWRHWRDVIKNICPDMDVLLSGDDYGKRLAHDQGVPWFPVNRCLLPISATSIKANPYEMMHHLIPQARRCLIPSVVVLGNESTGKTTLCERLAEHFGTIVVPEYAENYLKRVSPDWTEEAFIRIHHGQQALRRTVMPHAKGLVIEDSHTLSTAVFASVAGHEVASHALFEQARLEKPHHVLLLTSDTPFVPDTHRLSSREDGVDDMFEKHLREWGWSYTKIGGSYAERQATAIATVNDLITTWKDWEWKDFVGHSCIPRN